MIRHFSMLLTVGGLAIGLAAGSQQAAAKGPGTTGNSGVTFGGAVPGKGTGAVDPTPPTVGPGTTGNSDVTFTTIPGSGSGNPLPSPAKK